MIKDPLPGLAAVACLLLHGSAAAWVFPEHTRATLTALDRLRSDDAWNRILIDAWRRVRLSESWACEDVESDVGKQGCFGFAALPSLAGDHSCEPEELARSLANLAKDKWIIDVVRDATETGQELEEAAGNSSKREDVRRGMHLKMQSDDGQYLTRANDTHAHFQLEREAFAYGDGPPSLLRYLEQSLATGQASNATALYANYHAAALLLARDARIACRSNTNACGQLTKKAFFAEAFALHFLEDSFAAGHIVGIRGDRSYSIGTHDYYSRHGIDARTWKGASYAAHGDAFLSDDDARFTGDAVAESLRQVLAVLEGENLDARIEKEIAPTPSYPTFNSCIELSVPSGLRRLAYSKLMTDVISYEPIPSSRTPDLPRFRSEVGSFFGASVTLDGGNEGARSLVVARSALRIGLGFAAISTAKMDSQVFVEAGFAAQRLDGSSSTGYALRVHAPFLVVPFDGIPATILAATFPSNGFLTAWATRAAGGGLLGLQRQHGLTDNLTVQVSVLRDASLLIFHNEPVVGQSQYALLLPLITFRYALPFAGLVTSDGILDLGLLGEKTTRAPDSVQYSWGAYLSFSTGARIFP